MPAEHTLMAISTFIPRHTSPGRVLACGTRVGAAAGGRRRTGTLWEVPTLPSPRPGYVCTTTCWSHIGSLDRWPSRPSAARLPGDGCSSRHTSGVHSHTANTQYHSQEHNLKNWIRTDGQTVRQKNGILDRYLMD